MDAAWPLSHLFMIVVGIAALRAKRLTSWRRIAPLLCGLALPLFMAATVATGEGGGRYLFPTFTLVAFALLGYAVRSAAGADAAGRSAPAIEAKRFERQQTSGGMRCIPPLACVQVTVPPILFWRRHLSLRLWAQAAPSLVGVTHLRRRGGDASERGSANALRLPPCGPPHAPCSPSAGAVA